MTAYEVTEVHAPRTVYVEVAEAPDIVGSSTWSKNEWMLRPTRLVATEVKGKLTKVYIDGYRVLKSGALSEQSITWHGGWPRPDEMPEWALRIARAALAGSAYGTL